MYAGKKSHLKPIHDALIDLALSVAADMKICPCQTMVPVFRNHVIAQIKPTTLTRIDFGLCLKGHKGQIPRRLIDTGGAVKGDRITHRIEVASLDDIDKEVRTWLKKAYDLDA